MPTGPSAAYWRDKAEEARALAAGMNYAPARESLLRIAADYDRLAEYVDRNEAASAVLERPNRPGLKQL